MIKPWFILWSLGTLALPVGAVEHLRLPPWREIVLELAPALIIKAEVQKTSAGEAQSKLLRRPGTLPPAVPELFHLLVDTRLKWFLATKTWLGELWIRPDLTALQRTRLKSGKKRNYKIYRYAREGVYRIRQKPRHPDEAVPDWPVESERFYAYSPAVVQHCETISDPYVLLLLLSQKQLPTEQPICVFNKKNVYEVTLKRQDKRQTAFHYRFDDVKAQGTVLAEHIVIQATPVEPAAYPLEPFEFLGMEGAIEILRDPERRLPLQIEGKVPGFGRAKLRLSRVRLR